MRCSSLLLLLLIGCTDDTSDPKILDPIDEPGSDCTEVPYYQDQDGDGYGDEGAIAEEFCPENAPAGYVNNNEDCDDTNPDSNPGSAEECDEAGEDQDCDGLDDNEEGLTPTYSWYQDNDGDGYGDDATKVEECAKPGDNYVQLGGDCDDTNSAVHPDAVEDDCGDPTDYNCDGSVQYTDADGDGYAACEDCNDSSASANPGLRESCDDIDNDCDGEVDEDGSFGSPTWYLDADGDGYGTDSDTLTACDQPSGYASAGGDCDDSSTAFNPGASEECGDPTDYNCDGSVSYMDLDGDGFAACEDCNDGDNTVYPGAAETCNDQDDDCDGTNDEDATDATVWYADVDGDGYGDATNPILSCDPVDGYVDDGGDCDDNNSESNPDADERCDDSDNNCDGVVDEDDAVDVITWYVDNDGDGHGTTTTLTVGCDVPEGFAGDADDCDDTNAAISPSADETCNSIDDNCDGVIDEATAVDAGTWYLDLDSDGTGDPSTATVGCVAPGGYIADGTDCDDSNANVSPLLSEVCDDDNLDEDCDGAADDADDSATGQVLTYADTDSDGFGDSADTGVAWCDVPSGRVTDNTDCDDTNSADMPGAVEYCDGRDNNCDGTTDEASALDALTWYLDADGDMYGVATTTAACTMPAGYTDNADDCDDTVASTYPGATEYCNGKDDDCNDFIDDDAVDQSTWYLDGDDDNYGDDAFTSAACNAPDGYIAVGGDCDDYDPAVNPAAYEICDESDIDENCNGTVDDSDPLLLTTSKLTWYIDRDGDAYGSSTSSVTRCSQPSGYVDNADDCQDNDITIYPGATEICDGSTDEDCDGLIDDADSSVDSGSFVTFYADVDDDGFGDPSTTTGACSIPAGYTDEATDCDDADSDVNPDAAEVCGDGMDNNCDGTAGGCGLLQGLDASGAYSKLYSTSAGAEAGAVASAGDFDGDGLNDYAVGVDEADDGGSNAGTVYLFTSAASGTGTMSTRATTRLIGDDASDYAGTAVAGGGDVDHDGYDDLLVSAVGEDSGGSAAGAVYVVAGGSTGTLALSGSMALIYGENNSDYIGYSLSYAGNFFDGYGADSYVDDILIGAEYYDPDGKNNGGVAYVVEGPVSGNIDLTSGYALRLLGENASDSAGCAVSGVGDTDGDGWDDVIVGAYKSDQGATDGGAAYLVTGGIAGSLNLSTADTKIYGTYTSDHLGYRVGGGGDINADGYADVLISIYKEDDGGGDAGAVAVFYGPLPTGLTEAGAADARMNGGVSQEQFGAWVSNRSDVDGDSFADVLVGATGNDSGGADAGGVYIFRGPVAGTYASSSRDGWIVGEDAGDAAGMSVAGLGDVNGDGFGDILFSAPKDDTGGTDAGTVYLFLGAGI